MTTQRVYKTEAIVLKGIKLGEADKILTLYTPYLGKIRAVAKGIRRPKSKLRGHVETLTHSTLMLARGKNLDIITQGQTIHSFLPLRDSLWRTSHALYASELTDRFTAEQVENLSLFQLLLDALKLLCQTEDAGLIRHYFELHLLSHIGYRPQLERCIKCDSRLNPTANFFSIGGGGVLCPDCQHKESAVYPISLNALKTMRFLQNSDCSSATRLRINPRLSVELELLMQKYITYLLERRVESVKWIDKLREQG
ncbi:MAG: DNA repair protein RecO [Dehalococcoidia bacterium]|nr:DNA repair protein RecO [Dehalococcoidia bacterium]